jgi:TolA-binding protein
MKEIEMAELLEEQELDEAQLGETQPDEAQPDEAQLGETQPDEAQPDEAQLGETQLDETDEEEFALEEIGDNLGFLRDTSDNLNLYEAFQAYHEHRNFEDAIKKFRAAAAYERRHGASSEAGASGGENPNATLVKCLYWLAESHNKLEQRNKAIKAFETLAKDFDSHYLGMAAQRRAETLKAEA